MILSALPLLSVRVTTGQEPHCCGSTSPTSVTTSFTSEALHLSVYSSFNKASEKIARHLNYIKISTVLPLKKKKINFHMSLLDIKCPNRKKIVITYLGGRQN